MIRSAFSYVFVLLTVAVALVLSGCARKGRQTVIETRVAHDAFTGTVTEETRTEKHKAILGAIGYKLALEKFNAQEQRGEGPNAYSYSTTGNGLSAAPDSQPILELAREIRALRIELGELKN